MKTLSVQREELRYIKSILFSSSIFVLNITSNIPASKPLNFLWFEEKCRKNTLQADLGDTAVSDPDRIVKHRDKGSQ